METPVNRETLSVWAEEQSKKKPYPDGMPVPNTVERVLAWVLREIDSYICNDYGWDDAEDEVLEMKYKGHKGYLQMTKEELLDDLLDRCTEGGLMEEISADENEEKSLDNFLAFFKLN